MASEVTDVPEWAIERVNVLRHADVINGKPEHAYSCLHRAFARYISQHEEEPIDPVDAALEEALRSFCPNDLKLYGISKNGVRVFRGWLSRCGIELSKSGEA